MAEVLITLGIIGLVAIFVLPQTVKNIQSKIRKSRIENIQQKISKVMDKMAVTSGLIGYDSTMSFIEELKKHMTILKVCPNDRLGECWPYAQVDLGDGKIWDIADTKEPKHLRISKADRPNWDSTVGIITGDGIPMIISYNKQCAFNPDTGLTYNKESGVSNTINCIAGVYDWNGSSKPNKLAILTEDDEKDYDVLTIGMAGGLGTSCLAEIAGLCVAGKAVYMTWTQAMATGTLFTSDELKSMHSAFINNPALLTKLGLPQLNPDSSNYILMWANKESGDTKAQDVLFKFNGAVVTSSHKEGTLTTLFKGDD